MKRDKPARKGVSDLCGDIGPDDGADPRVFFRKAADKKLNRKALQLCSEVSRVLGHVLAWELGDERLAELLVESVIPCPDSSRLLITVSMDNQSGGGSPREVLERLNHCMGRLRAEVAAAIHRRRVPNLAFRLAPRREVDQ